MDAGVSPLIHDAPTGVRTSMGAPRRRRRPVWLFDTHARTLGTLVVLGLNGGVVLGAPGLLLSAAIAGSATNPSSPARAPMEPGRVCGNPALLDGPSAPPVGAVTVVSGENLTSMVAADGPGTTFWLSPGTYTFGRGVYSQIIPRSGDQFIGAPGAVIDGEHQNYYAFTQQATDVTVEYLTIQDFGIVGGNNNEGVVNHDSGTGWVVAHNTIRDNAGAGVMIGSKDVVEANCLTNNGQYGFNAYSIHGVTDIQITNNEISDNDTFNWQTRDPTCGCEGGGKLYETDGAVITGNFIHDNHDVGLWVDTDGAGFNISQNYISGNYAQGIFYEASYNARISDNTLVHNGLRDGRKNSGNFPIAAIYVSSSGSDKRVPGPYAMRLTITGNILVNNWAGVVLWDDANRFCYANGEPCTLVNPSKFNQSTCDRGNLAKAEPGQRPVNYYEGCRWTTQNVWVTRNTFRFDPSVIGRGCVPSNGCGLQGLFVGAADATPAWSPYQESAVQDAVTQHAGNVFEHNFYKGPWLFMVHDQRTVVSFRVWQHDWRQDAHSTFSG